MLLNKCMIMRKEYVKPEVAVEEILLESYMLGMSGTEVGNEPVDPFANERQDRGTWGDFWN